MVKRAELSKISKSCLPKLNSTNGFFIGDGILLNNMALKLNIKLRILEFIVAGILLDLTENIIFIKLMTRAELTPSILLVALTIVVPFAIVTELIIDHPNFWYKILRIKRQ